MKGILTVTGPTGSGKTKLSVDLAKTYGLEVISFDARQFYREIPIGTAQPDAEEMQGVKHHFIGSHSVFAPLHAMEFRAQALPIMEQKLKEDGGIVLVGGSGLYLSALLFGFDAMPEVSEGIRQKVRGWSLEQLQTYVEKNDPKYFQEVDRQNPVRLMRATEIMEQSGIPYSGFRKGKTPVWPFPVRHEVWDLTPDRTELRMRIEKRLEGMLAKGLKKEALEWAYAKNLTPFKTVGYQEWYVGDGVNDADVQKQIVHHSMQYAKRQRTWFGKFWKNHPWDAFHKGAWPLH